MLRRNCPLVARAIKKTWKKNSTSDHFLQEAAPSAAELAADPALRRTSGDDAKERKRFKFINYRPQDSKQFEKIKLWGQLIRLDKPAGTRLLFIPCLWGAGLAVTKCMVYHGADWLALMSPFVPLTHAMIMYWGAFNLRSAGCIINDMWDRDLDRLVERTKDRPLASGRMSMLDASILLGVHLTMGAAMLTLMSPVSVQIAVAAMPLVITYPLMKRFTFFPQLYLGLTYNWGIWVGYAAVANTIDLPVLLPIFVAAVCWTMLYDTIYAYQDRPDDIKAGIKSTAVYFGENKRALYGMMGPIVPLIMLSGVAAGQNVAFMLGAVAAGWQLMGVIDHVNIKDPWSCQIGFRRNVRFGYYIFLAMVAGNLVWIFVYESAGLTEKLNTATPVLAEFMLGSVRLNALAEGKDEFDPTSFTWLDRLLKPGYVYATVQERQGKTAEQITIPAWVRREYTISNIMTVLRLTCSSFIAEETLNGIESTLYRYSDHYNVISLASL